MTTSINRRNALTAIAAVPAASLPALTAAAEPNPDAELLELGRQWDVLADRWWRAREIEEPRDEAFQEKIEEASARANGASLAEQDYRAMWAEAEAAHPPPSPNCDDLSALMSPLEEQILALPATTIAGLAVKARLAEQHCSDLWSNENDESTDYHDLVARKLIDAVLAAAEAVQS